MKKKHVTWIILAALVVLAALLWHSYLTDPLASYKEATVEVIEKQTDLQEFMDSVITAIDKNNQRGLYALFGSGDPMAFNRNYLKKVFKERDFCPVEIRQYRRLTRSANNEVFYQADVFSTKRNKSYIFTIEKNNGKFKVASVEEP